MKNKINKTIRETRDQSLFERIADQYCKKDRRESSIIARRHRLLQTFNVLPQKKYSKLLEVGCACGYAASYLHGRYKNYVGIDYSKNLIAYAKETNNLPDADFIAVNVKDYNNNELFDVIFMIGVLHHIDKLEENLIQIINKLKPGGWFVANEPQSANKIIQLMRNIRSKTDSKYSSDQIVFSKSDLYKLYNSVGLENINIIPQGIFSTPFAEVIIKPDSLAKALSKVCVSIDTVFE
ncbi:Methyltransferase type 11 domain protein, partial [Candidatus Magnetomorum sp. HK-1]